MTSLSHVGFFSMLYLIIVFIDTFYKIQNVLSRQMQETCYYSRCPAVTKSWHLYSARIRFEEIVQLLVIFYKLSLYDLRL